MPPILCSCHRSFDQQGALRATHVVLLHHTEMDVMAPSVASLATLIASVRAKLAAWRGAAAAAEDVTDYVAAVDLHVMSVLVSSSLSSLEASPAAGRTSRPGDDHIVAAVNGTPPPPKVQLLVQVTKKKRCFKQRLPQMKTWDSLQPIVHTRGEQAFVSLLPPAVRIGGIEIKALCVSQ
jgi:hypothetical protein